MNECPLSSIEHFTRSPRKICRFDIGHDYCQRSKSYDSKLSRNTKKTNINLCGQNVSSSSINLGELKSSSLSPRKIYDNINLDVLKSSSLSPRKIYDSINLGELKNLSLSPRKIYGSIKCGDGKYQNTYVLEFVYGRKHDNVMIALTNREMNLYPVTKKEITTFRNTEIGSEIIKILEDDLVQTSVLDQFDDSCLGFVAAYLGDIEMLKVLRTFGMLPTSVGCPHRNISMYAAENGNLKTLQWLVEVAETPLKITTVDCAEMNGHHEIVEWILIEKKVLQKDSLMHVWYYFEYAVAEGRLKLLKELHESSPKWPIEISTNITTRTSDEVVDYMWNHGAPMYVVDKILPESCG